MTAREPDGGNGASKRTADPKTILGAGSKAYGWLRNALGFYGTAVTVVQLVPAVIALLVVFFSPTAWLSATLRRWVGMGAVAGTLAGMLVLARVAGPRTLRALVRGGVARSDRLTGLAWWGTCIGLLAAAAFRLHLAVVDVAFVQTVPVLTPVLDFYLGGGPAAATVYNALAAALAGLAVAGIVAGAPAAVLRWRERRAARQALLAEGGPLAAIDVALKALEEAKTALQTSKATIVQMGDELDDRRAAAARQAAKTAEATSAGDPPTLRAPRVDAGRSHR